MPFSNIFFFHATFKLPKIVAAPLATRTRKHELRSSDLMGQRILGLIPASTLPLTSQLQWINHLARKKCQCRLFSFSANAARSWHGSQWEGSSLLKDTNVLHRNHWYILAAWVSFAR